jgi:hypothetical protein
LLGSKRTKELSLLVSSLESTMTKLGAGIDEFKIDNLKMLPGGVVHHALSQNKRTLLYSNTCSLDHDPVLVDLTIVDESSHRCDSLLGQVGSGTARSSIVLLSNSVNLLVHLGTMEVSVLTSTWYGGAYTSRMPRSDTSNLTKTTMGLTGKTGNSPSVGDTLETLTLCNSDDVNVLVLREDRVHSDLLLEEGLRECNLGSSIGSSVDLDLHDVSLLHTKVQLLDLSVCDDTYYRAELGDAVELMLNILSTILVLLRVLGESLLLGLEPVLVTTSLELLGKMLCKDGGQGAKTTRGLDVSHHSYDDHGRGLEDGDRVDDLALVHEGTGTVHSTNDVGHTSLVPTECGEVGSGGGVEVLGEGTDATGVVLGTLLGEESQVTGTGCFELTVRHGGLSRWVKE